MSTADHESVSACGRYDVTLVTPEDPRRESAMTLAVMGSPLVTAESRRQCESLCQVARDQGLGLDPLFAADQRGVLLGAALAIQSPGRSAMMHPAGAIEQPRRVLVDLLRASVEALFGGGVRLVQGLVHPGDDELPQTYRAAEFSYLTDLIYMEADAARDGPAIAAPPGIHLATYESARQEVFLRALEMTYIDSLDCPGLTGLRSTADVLLGHRATGIFDPNGWYVALRGRAPVAVLLTARVSRASALEIVYLGVAPEERGRGVGQYLMQVAHDRARQLALSVITLALDATNEPARRLYDDWGCRATQRRRVWIATPPNAPNGGCA